MRIKKYIVSNMKEGLSKIKTDMGPNAVILQSKKIQKGHLYNLFGKEMIEITAATDTGLPEKIENVSKQEPMFTGSERSTSNQMSALEKRTIENNFLELLFEDIKYIKEMLKYGFIQEKSRKLYKEIRELGISEHLALKIISAISDEEGDEKQLLKKRIMELIPADISSGFRNGKTTTLAFVGPTGVGKTTTIAKLAANYTIFEKAKVGLITIDTYRVAAVEQLKTFADIVDIPIQVVNDPIEFAPAIDRFRNNDVILIDTAGRSPNNEVHMTEIESFFKAFTPDEVHLVLSATTKYEDLLKTVKRFNILHPNRLLFTKLDETDSYGAILDVIAEMNSPVSYYTFGQSVPDDIQPAKREKLAELILNNVKLI